MGFFDFITAPVASTAAGVSDFFGQRSANTSNRDIARDANAFSAKQSQVNRDFQERMSNTSWQRGVADMKKAGINPMLAFSQGGASAPSGSSASGVVGAPQQSTTSRATASAMDAMRLRADLKNADAQNEVLHSQARLNDVSARKVAADTGVITSNSQKAKLKGDFYSGINSGVSSAKGFVKSIVNHVKAHHRPFESTKTGGEYPTWKRFVSGFN